MADEILRTRGRPERTKVPKESRETRADGIVIMHLDAMAVVPENPQSFSTGHRF
jgi:hypothetical protein